MRSVLMLVSLLLAPTLAFAGKTPVSTIEDVRQALDTADQQLFDASVYMESFMGQCVDIFLDEAQRPEGQASLPPVLGMILSSVGKSGQARDTLRATLIKEASELVRYGVRSGSYAGRQREAQPPSGMLAPLFSDASMGRKEIFDIGEPVADRGAVYVPFSLKDHGNGNTYPVQAWLRQENNNWRVIGLRNPHALTRMILKEAAQGTELNSVTQAR